MPGTKTRRKPKSPPSGSPPPGRPARPSSATTPAATWELVESLREEFEEASAHAMKESTTPLTIRPLRELGSSEVDAGVVGWRSSVAAGTSGSAGTELGEMILLLLPKGGTSEVDPAGDPPVRGLRWTDVDSLSLRSGETTVLLLTRPAEPAFRGHLAEVAELLRAEFAEE